MLIRRIGVCFLILILSVPALMLYSILMYILLNPSNPIHYHWMNYIAFWRGYSVVDIIDHGNCMDKSKKDF